MKTIGLIGGMSWESSKLYYESVNTKVKEELGGSHSCKNIMITVDFAEIEKLTFEGDWDGIGEIIKDAAIKLERAGADIVLLCTNTIHLVSNYISDNISIPFLHIAEATGLEIKKKGLRKVGLLGTRFTMEKDFYKGYIKENHGIEVIVPNEADRKIVHDIIYNELVKGQFTEVSKEKCLKIIKTLQKDGAEGIILGCTELPILIPSSEVEIPTLDTGTIHAQMAVEWALNNNN
ncbi:aspartate racemase [Saonia flava]|uniref:Aspartate racemase n=1 Tax=Saonia flava TaxID=523696 RepID=A0A846QPD7_9FLAO|nr:aspartate/glutamate racemase family protein [Saonia flava]NJB69968.1 aspartate racemase [Saonia flava]